MFSPCWKTLVRKQLIIGKVGQDMFGDTASKEAVEEVGIDTRNLIMDPVVSHHSGISYILIRMVDRDFSFYRDPGADMMLDQRRSF